MEENGNTEKRLTEGSAREQIEKAAGEFRTIRNYVKRGIITEDECSARIDTVFQKGFYSFLSEAGIRMRVNADSYSSFAADHLAFQKDEEMPGSVPWLYSRKQAASSEEKRSFFLLMDWFGLSPEVFEPVPEQTARPERLFVHMYHGEETCSARFDCTDDGGLTGDPSPVGKTFELTEVHGLKAVIRILEDRRHTDRRGLDFDELVTPWGGVCKAEFLGEGRIDGYTAEERSGNPKILIRLDGRDGKVCRLGYHESSDDFRAFIQYPLWQDYFAIERRREAEIHDRVQSVFDRLTDTIPE